MLTKLIVVGFLTFARIANAQQLDALIFIQDTEPTSNVSPGTFWLHSDGTLKLARTINPSNWIIIGGGGGEGIPSGLITFIESGSCASGWTEISSLNGVTLVGTIAANVDVGQTGGANLITPLGSVSAPTLTMNSYTPSGVNSALTFTGSALGTHLHAFGTLSVAAHTVVATKQGAAAGNVVTTATHTVSGSTAAITAGTPAGTINTPSFTGNAFTLTGSISVPSFTGTQFDNRSAFKKVIFCRKD